MTAKSQSQSQEGAQAVIDISAYICAFVGLLVCGFEKRVVSYLQLHSTTSITTKRYKKRQKEAKGGKRRQKEWNRRADCLQFCGVGGICNKFLS
jgi:hypothetical protein